MMARVVFADREYPRLIKARSTEASAEHALAAATAQLAATLRRESARRARLVDEFSAGLTQCSMVIAKKFLAQTLRDKPEALLELMEPLVRGLQSATRLRIEAHPLDAAILRTQAAALSDQQGSEPLSIDIEENSTLSRGSLLLDSDVGALDGRLETRFGLVAAALAKAMESSL